MELKNQEGTKESIRYTPLFVDMNADDPVVWCAGNDGRFHGLSTLDVSHIAAESPNWTCLGPAILSVPFGRNDIPREAKPVHVLEVKRSPKQHGMHNAIWARVTAGFESMTCTWHVFSVELYGVAIPIWCGECIYCLRPDSAALELGEEWV